MSRATPEVRDAILAHLRQAHPSMCRRWFDDIEPLDLAGGTLKLLVREPLQLKYLRKNCQVVFTGAAQAVTGMLLVVRFVGLDEAGGMERPRNGHARPAEPAPRPAQEPNRTPLDGGERPWEAPDEMVISPDYSFENFVVGPANQLAHSAAFAVAQRPAAAYNPFFIHGGVGLGKTHLLQAICQETLRLSPGFRIYYTSCHDFVDQFYDAVRAGQMSSFRHRFRDVDALIVDDIHDLGAERSQEEFFHTFNALSQAGKQVVLSSDAAPTELPDFQERLTSRFGSGLVAPIKKPCYETRVAIVKSKALMRQVGLPDDVAAFIATRIDSNIRELEGAITTLQGIAAATGGPIDLGMATEALGAAAAPESFRPTIQSIVEVVTGYYSLKLSELLGKRRHRSIVVPRQICMWLARKHTRFSLQEIGGYFGGRDHTTVMHAVSSIDRKRREEPDTTHDLVSLEQLLAALPPRAER